MRKNDGFALIEVVISLMILSVVLVVFVTSFGDVVNFTFKGGEITHDTFELQEDMENEILLRKEEFTDPDSSIAADYDVEIFTEDTHYDSDVAVKEIAKVHSTGKKYITLVSNVKIAERKEPNIEMFSVGAYLDDDYNFSNEVFPWYEDNIVIGAKYQISDDPIIFENRLRWYRSNEDIINPYFSSCYTVISEETVETPTTTEKKSHISKDSDDIVHGRYYYFELRPYTLAGRVTHRINENRILVLNKPTDKLGNLLTDFMNIIEGFYFTSNPGDTVKYIDDDKLFVDVILNPERATLNFDWDENKDSEGPLLGTKVPSKYVNKSYITSINFRVDEEVNFDEVTNLGFGYFIGDVNSNGNMISIDPINNEITIN
ncbi:MAG: prepilin-type N-terminal cleavage/methylation domain-containing protein, partial [Clostridiales bacterium]|nr:prepilin-type N-terminal cleavage/methylation domain-containing protein [Clostridiales bacterium]